MKSKTRRALLIVSILGVLLSVGGYVGYRAYVSVRQARLISQARAYLGKAKERKAVLCLQRALLHNPDDLEACRLMATVAEASHSPAALLMRSRVVDLNPRSWRTGWHWRKPR